MPPWHSPKSGSLGTRQVTPEEDSTSDRLLADFKSTTQGDCVNPTTTLDSVHTRIPPSLARLSELSLNIWWSWTVEARQLFETIDPTLWFYTHHNPVKLLADVKPGRLGKLADDPSYLRQYSAVLKLFDEYKANGRSWFSAKHSAETKNIIAYFSAEFGLHTSIPIYSGGLGILAGDHCKEASDLGVPLVGIGFMYPQGYFRQRITADGWQQEVYEKLNWTSAPVEPAITSDGTPCITAVPLGNRTVLVAVWRVRVGRVKLYLLDTDLEENAPWDRELSARLYGGDRETRVQQEIVLGVGGVRVLKAMGYTPAVYHLNEGHAAFVVLQRIRDLCEHGWSFEHALAEVRRTTVFTTH